MKPQSEHDSARTRQSKIVPGARPLGRGFDQWQEITFRPAAYFRESRFELGAAWRLFLQNVMLGILIFLALAGTYWFLLLTRAAEGHWKYYLTTLVFLTCAPLLLCFASGAMIVLPSLIAYGAFRLTGGSGGLSEHLSRTLVCSNFEWLSGSLFSTVLLFNDYAEEYDSPLPFPISPSVIALVSLVGFLSIRIYYSILQMKALHGLHYGELSRIRRGASWTLLALNLLGGTFVGAMYAAMLLISITNLD